MKSGGTLGAAHGCSSVAPLPQPEPRITRILLIVFLIRGLPIGHPERPFVRQRQDVLQNLDFGDGLFGVHAVSITNFLFARHLLTLLVGRRFPLLC